MDIRRPDIFISATTADLGPARQVVKEALLLLGMHPVEQTNFPPDHRTIKAMLRDTIARCDAVVHLAGKVYGAEPRERAADVPRRSYTQLEYDVARELGKPLYVFVTGNDFPCDSLPAEDEEKRRLQATHRDAVLGSDHARYSFSGIEDLQKQIRGLQTHLEKLRMTLKRDRRHFAWMAGTTLVLLVIIGALVIALPGKIKPGHDYVIEGSGLAPLFLQPEDFKTMVETRSVMNPPAGRLMNGTPVRILDRKLLENLEQNLPAEWLHIEVLGGPDKGKRAWTFANRVKQIQ